MNSSLGHKDCGGSIVLEVSSAFRITSPQFSVRHRSPTISDVMLEITQAEDHIVPEYACHKCHKRVQPGEMVGKCHVCEKLVPVADIFLHENLSRVCKECAEEITDALRTKRKSPLGMYIREYGVILESMRDMVPMIEVLERSFKII